MYTWGTVETNSINLTLNGHWRGLRPGLMVLHKPSSLILMKMYSVCVWMYRWYESNLIEHSSYF